ncbi:hypothetical protein QC763_609490 [Podospora pseudopauciseta]|uniref:Ribosomal protein S21 n=1 Tax=Podospora pseudopauciseta TaxID=2093780 RepID=A0ABR0H6P6_9PEZI|nr:hypothetical protein QC763_609490 [Podospora pseudopauciseta]
MFELPTNSEIAVPSARLQENNSKPLTVLSTSTAAPRISVINCFRPLAQICRTATSSSTKPSPLLLNLTQTSHFSTARVLRREATAAATSPSTTTTTTTSRPQQKILGLASKLNRTPAPRPPPLKVDPLFGPSSSSSTGSLSTSRSSLFNRTVGKKETQVFSAIINRDAKESLSKESSGTLSNLTTALFMTNAGLQTPDIRLRPTSGRTVPVKSNDPARAFKVLNALCRHNNLSNTVREQRFHERPALKRKRKLRERWRTRFKDGFVAVIDRTMELRKQGW